MADGEITQASLNPVTTAAQSDVDKALQALDPDAARPECVMRSVNLSLGFSGRLVMSDVNVDLKRGSITALIGPTGSGKSTFLRTLNRMNDRVPGFTVRATSRSTMRACGRSTSTS